MSFWNYLGLAYLIDTLFGRKCQSGCSDVLDRRLNNLDPDSMLYFDLEDEIDDLRDEIDDLDDIYDDEAAYLDDLDDY